MLPLIGEVWLFPSNVQRNSEMHTNINFLTPNIRCIKEEQTWIDEF